MFILYLGGSVIVSNRSSVGTHARCSLWQYATSCNACGTAGDGGGSVASVSEAASEASCGASSYAPTADDDEEGTMLGAQAAEQVAHLHLPA